MTIADILRESIKRVEKDKKFGPDSGVAKFYREQLKRTEGMIGRGRFTANPDGPDRRVLGR